MIALTGGIASGKSTVAQRLAEHGGIIIDADRVAREVVEPGMPALAEIASTFGPGVLKSDGSLDRPALGAIIFTDEALRLKLNGITHPAVWKRTREILDQIERERPDAVVIYDVPLLVEASPDRPMTFEKVIVVEAPAVTRINRLVELRGMTASEARARVESQASDEQRRAVADLVINSDGTLSETLSQVDELWPTLSGAVGTAPDVGGSP